MPPSPEEMQRAIRQAFAEIDPRQIAIWREMSPERRNQIINNVISSARQVAIESEQQRHPDLPPKKSTTGRWPALCEDMNGNPDYGRLFLAQINQRKTRKHDSSR